jgi:ATP-dependent RNA helicase DeaD
MSFAFEDFGLDSQLLQAIKELGYDQPTPIQIQAIPVLLSGRDMVGQAQTGTGKTAAFALPMLQKIEPGQKHVQALVMAPTRELAIQVAEAIRQMASASRLRVMAIYGGQSYTIQTRQLERGMDVVVGTPGRMIDLINQKKLDLSHVRFLVLDEADEMLEMGFVDDVETILKQVPEERQVALFSATMPEAVRKLSAKYLKDPLRVRIDPTHITVAETEQRYYRVREDDKLSALTRLLEMEEVKSALIFARTKARTQELADELNRRGYPAESLHGDLNQARREMVLNRFRNSTVTLLVATDVAARGLDIDDISHVFNFDIPQDAEDYVHRIGRTGRAGRKGIAVTFITPRERRGLGFIEAYTKQPLKECRIPGRVEIQARRDELFLQRLTEQLGKGKITHERALIAKLEETSFDLVEIAAAAIRMARAGEVELALEEIVEVQAESKKARLQRRDVVILDQVVSSKKDHKSGRKGTREDSSQGANKAAPQPWLNKRSHGGSEAGMVRLMMNLGVEQGVRPGDIVGAIASEVGIPGKAIGEIDIRRDHTFVDVAEKHVRQVLKESTGKYFLRGKAVMLKLAS